MAALHHPNELNETLTNDVKEELRAAAREPKRGGIFASHTHTHYSTNFTRLALGEGEKLCFLQICSVLRVRRSGSDCEESEFIQILLSFDSRIHSFCVFIRHCLARAYSDPLRAITHLVAPNLHVHSAVISTETVISLASAHCPFHSSKHTASTSPNLWKNACRRYNVSAILVYFLLFNHLSRRPNNGNHIQGGLDYYSTAVWGER